MREKVLKRSAKSLRNIEVGTRFRPRKKVRFKKKERKHDLDQERKQVLRKEASFSFINSYLRCNAAIEGQLSYEKLQHRDDEEGHERKTKETHSQCTPLGYLHRYQYLKFCPSSLAPASQSPS